jgi:hypothetical protein
MLGSPSSRAISVTAAAMLPPTLLPVTASLLASTPISSPFWLAETTAAWP